MMEENSKAHMETDVSSTTDDVPESQEVTESHHDVETVIVVETLKEEEDCSIDSKDEQSQATITSSATTCTEISPRKETLPQITPVNSPVKQNNASQSLLKSPMNKLASQKVIITKSLVSVPAIKSPVKEPESSDSSTKTDSKIPEKCVEKPGERSLLKISNIQNVSSIPLPKEIQPEPDFIIKVVNVPEKSSNEEIIEQEGSIIIQDKPAMDVLIQKSTSKEVSSEIQDVSSPNKIKGVQENVTEQVKLREGSPIKENLIELSNNVELKVAESSNEEVHSLDNSSSENKCQDSTSITLSKVVSTSDECDSNSIVVSNTSNANETTSTVNGGDTILATAIPTNMTLEEDILNDSLGSSDISEKDHNKSISRELKSLIKSAKDSKIISECTQLTTKTRKSRSQLDTSNASLNVSVEPDKVGGTRRVSTNSQVSNCSEKSDRGVLKRSMRSQNPEFVNKCKKFLNSVTSKVTKDSDEAMSADETDTENKDKADIESEHEQTPTVPKKKKISEQPVLNDKKIKKMHSDAYCWRCHWTVEQEENDKAHPPLQCSVCPRAYHFKCLSGSERKTSSEKNWVCPDCLQILQAEGSDTRSLAMKKTSLGMLCDLLKYALERMMDLNGVEPFMRPVDRTAFPHYDKYVVHPMDLMQMKQNIADGHYGSTEAFIADAQWILHNSIIFNTLQSKLTGGARALVRSCRAEMGEIEACPECYSSAHARKPTWFTDVCTTPHILLWAKLKGFPFWPAKGMTVNSSGLVDVRFFGAHDRAWVPAKDCFLFSEKDPNNFRTKRQDILDSMQEAEQHIRNISRKYGKFVYPPFKTQFDPSKLTEQVKMMIPSFEGEIKTPLKDKPISASPLTAKVNRRSNSKGSKSSAYDGDGSESEDTSSSARTETIKYDKDTTSEKLVKLDTPTVVTHVVDTISTRKRRRSNLEEAVMTVIESSTPEIKKRKTDNTEQKKAERQEASSSKEEKAKSITKAEVAESTTKKKSDTPKSKSKDEEPSSSTMVEKESLRVTPIKLVALPRPNKQTPKLFTTTKVSSKANTSSADEDKTPQRAKKLSTPTGDEVKTSQRAKKLSTPSKDENKTPQKAKKLCSTSGDDDKTPQRSKSIRSEKLTTTEKTKDDKAKSLKRRDSKGNRSSNSSTTPKAPKTAEKKAESNNEAKSKELGSKDDNNKQAKESNSERNTSTADSSSVTPADSSKNSKDRLQFDDDLTLAVLARKTRHPNAGWPTISNVISLSGFTQPDGTPTQIPNTSQNIEITVETSSDSSVFTPTSTDSVRNMKEAVTKLQKLREETNTTDTMVGRVGVRAFARMTSPERAKESLEVEIKAEPIDLDEIDADRHSEKMDLMTACKLRPVGAGSSLRDVRINRVSSGPVRVTGGAETRPRARKTFPMPRRVETTPAGTAGTAKTAGTPRSELTVKNSMVYIPIQPPATQPPPRAPRPNEKRPAAPFVSGNNTVNTVITPLKPTSTLSSPSSSTSSIVPTGGQVVVATVGQVPTVGQGPTVGQVPTTVHTVPLMTSVNGQWMFSLQPVMSVGGVDNVSTSPMVNGVTDRGNTLLPLAPTATLTAAPAPSTPANRTANDNNTPTELPRLQQRPSLPNPFDTTSSAGVALPTPSTAGPLTAKLNQGATKLSHLFRTLLEDCMEKLDDPTTIAATLSLQLEQARWRHQQEIDELKHNHELTLSEMRLSFEKDKMRVMSDAKRVALTDLEAAVKHAKSKQWCANCNQEAHYYCCWNTAYCDLPCQRAHWSQHALHCAQRSKGDDATSPAESRLQSQSDSLPVLQKSTVPVLTVGGKVATTRIFSPQDSAQQKTSIIMSMVEDTSGNQTMKCVGTYKPSQAQGQMSPLMINKQVINEETSKKVVTSGGYLIVGSGNNSASVITPAPSRRHHTIQYFT